MGGDARYYRHMLGRADARAYDDVESGLRLWQPGIEVAGASPARALELFEIVMADNPDLIHVAPAASASGSGRRSVLEPAYHLGRSAASARWAAIDRRLRDYKALLSPGDGDYEKAEKAYSFLIGSCEYGFSADDQNMCSALVDGISCCAGYAKALSFLLSSVGVCAPVVTGTAAHAGRRRGNHAWNAICIDGRWSLCDATWGDPVMSGGAKRPGDVEFEYLCATERELAATHSPDPLLADMLPSCSWGGDRWHVRHNLMFDSYDVSRIGTAVQADVLAREIRFGMDLDGDVHVRFGNASAYGRAKREFISDVPGMLAPVYRAYNHGTAGFSFSANDEMLALHVRYSIVPPG